MRGPRRAFLLPVADGACTGSSITLIRASRAWAGREHSLSIGIHTELELGRCVVVLSIQGVSERDFENIQIKKIRPSGLKTQPGRNYPKTCHHVRA